MKKTTLAVIALLLVFSFTTAQKRPVKRVQVRTQTIASLPTGKPYALDLTRKGTIYNLPANIDFGLVRIRTAKGEIVLSDLKEKRGKSGRLMVGFISDLRDSKLNLGSPGVVARYTCEGPKCKCTGDAECNEMFNDEVCGDIASCDTGNGTCECYKKF